MGANSGSLAISELFGAAAVITTVVLAIITIIQPFSVDPRAFVGDIVWFMVAASLLVAFIADGQLVLGECLGIIGLYVAFVMFAIFHPRGGNQTSTQTPIAVIGTDTEDDSNREDLLIDATGEDAASERTLLRSHDMDDESEPNIADINSRSPCLVALHGVDAAEEELLSTPQELEDLGLPPDVHVPTQPSDAVLPAPRKDSWLKLFPSIQSWSEQSRPEKALTILSLPLLLPIAATTLTGLETDPELTADPEPLIPGNAVADSPAASSQWRLGLDILHNWLRIRRFPSIPSLEQLLEHRFFCLQLLLGPQFFSLVFISQAFESASSITYLLGSSLNLLVSMTLLTYLAPVMDRSSAGFPAKGPRLLLSTLGFTTSLTWIYLTATSAVSLLMTLAFILNIPTALLGATVFAIGQSSNDLVAIAKRGMPVLAASTAYGGPMMNMLLGIGGGGLIQVLKVRRDGGTAYKFQPAVGMFVSAACLLVGMGATLGYAFSRSWRLDKRLGVGLMVVWSVLRLGMLG
jgi:Ca2+/Na+ antiporter